MGFGADRVRAHGVDLSPLGAKVADLLDCVWAGIYHLPHSVEYNTKWADPYYIAVTIPDHDLATWDFNRLTELVVLCHDAALRLEIEACNPHHVRLVFHQRKRSGSISERHPTMEEATTAIRKDGSGFITEHGVPEKQT